MNTIKLSILLLLLTISCTKTEEIEKEIIIDGPTFTHAVATVNAVGESGVIGTVYFEAIDSGVSVKAELAGLQEGLHGFHIHQFGDCTAPDGTSAGGHFNPEESEHSGPESAIRHMGDMGNVEADAEGNATINYVDNTININMIVGRGVIVHAGEDDLTSQPTGAAGARLGCGVIGISK